MSRLWWSRHPVKVDFPTWYARAGNERKVTPSNSTWTLYTHSVLDNWRHWVPGGTALMIFKREMCRVPRKQAWNTATKRAELKYQGEFAGQFSENVFPASEKLDRRSPFDVLLRLRRVFSVESVEFLVEVHVLLVDEVDFGFGVEGAATTELLPLIDPWNSTEE